MVCVVCLIACGASASAQDCTIRDLGPGLAFDINDQGEIVGFNGSSGPLYWSDASAAPTTLQPVPGWSFAYAVAINNNGAIVGNASDGSTFRAVYWGSPTAAPVVLATGPGVSRTIANDINDAGEIVGEGGSFAAALFWPSAFSTPIALTDGSSAQSINASGRVVGFAGGFVGRFWENAFVAPQILSPLPGGAVSFPFAVNNANQIVGLGQFHGLQTALSWGDASAIPVALVNGPEGGAAKDVNDSGQIVGWGDTLGAIFVASASATAVPLGKFGRFGGSAAEAINSAGLIAGYSQTQDVSTHAAVWGPLPPGSRGCQAEVTVDIRPGAFPNIINLKSNGSLPAAILGTADFDAATVDASSVTLAGAPVARRNNGTVKASLEDVDGDGRVDLLMHFDIEAMRLNETDVSAPLAGYTVQGMLIRGKDSVQVIKP